ncbi:hypothetical protein GCM10011611_18000 [Aliidongia dinghuensis]|uniref:SHSP domain-containing protein n=1 Tax=Aliidongia dinghuensis TaxID=1867774 RepID=A0A8J3E1K1_9PROT|nr:Hsp20 family protein [Aliidongia dinghuensis]GGF12749.1 hypothetical protein GCM10011611_18000 [Aliidongia dinghuensis]
MREFDFRPLYRSGIGFDHIAGLMRNAVQLDANNAPPPYNIERAGENAYRVTMAVAGFLLDELSLTVEGEELVVCGTKQGEDSGRYLHRGIATLSFERRFELAPFIKVTGAKLENGLLPIDLERELPKEMRARRIEIAQGGGGRQAIGKKVA